MFEVDLRAAKRSCFLPGEEDRMPRRFAVIGKGPVARSTRHAFQMTSRDSNREISHNRQPETNPLAPGIRRSQLIAKTLRHGFFVLTPVSSRVSFQQNSVDLF